MNSYKGDNDHCLIHYSFLALHVVNDIKMNTMKSNMYVLSATLLAGMLLTACGGGGNKSEVDNAASKTQPTSMVATVDGEAIFKKTCITCHMANGEGVPNTFPPLAKSDFLANRENVIHQVLKGKTGELVVNGVTYNNTMPPQALNDEEIAAVLTYVYSNFGNQGEPVTVDEVKAVRDKAE